MELVSERSQGVSYNEDRVKKTWKGKMLEIAVLRKNLCKIQEKE